MKLNVNEREALLIVSALGVFQNRQRQKMSWDIRKRKPVLRSQLADCVLVADFESADKIRKAMKKIQGKVERNNCMIKELNELRMRLKAEANIVDERL